MSEPGATMRVEERGDGELLVVLAGELDVNSLAALRPQVDDLLGRSDPTLTVDLTEVSFMDSSGLAVLLELAHRFGPLAVRRPTPIVRRVIASAGLGEVLREAEG